MTHYDYERSKQIVMHDEPFYALIMAAMRRADTYNLANLRDCWPHVWDELNARYNSPGGLLPGDPEFVRDEPFLIASEDGQ